MPRTLKIIVAGKCRDEFGFTLIELLTVAMILGILVTLLLPAILSGREKGRTTRCLGNHHQIVLAWEMYASDNGDKLVPNPDSTLEQGQGYGWVIGNVRMPGLDTNAQIMADSKASWLAPYIKNVNVYKCPSDESEFPRSVSMNCRMNPTRYDGVPAWVGGLGTNFVSFRKSSEIDHSADMLVVLDERSDSINDAYFAIDMSNTGSADGTGAVRKYTVIDFPGDYHNDAVAASYADGHAGLHHWRDFVKRTPLGSAHPRQVSRPDEQDVKWLEDHSTYPK